jgi:ubiquinone/menaquinone biosynthesis C-methylase UbiE
MSVADRVHFRMMSLIHEDLYRVLRDPYEVLKSAGLVSGQDVLEVGCGPGFFTVPAARIVGKRGTVHALDVNPLALEKVRQKVEQEGVTNVCTILADAGQTGLPSESFDFIFAFGLGHVVGGADRMIAELHRLLRPGGTLSIEGRLKPNGELFRAARSEGRITQYRKAVSKAEAGRGHGTCQLSCRDAGPMTQGRYCHD